jgi:hypothetical protein
MRRIHFLARKITNCLTRAAIPVTELQRKKVNMIKIKFFALLITGIVIMSGCKKYNVTSPYPAMSTNKTPKENLTQKPWRLLSYGFDHNKNGLVDIDEESIRDCQKDNSYTYNIDGSGMVIENAMICDTNVPVNQFAWSLTNNDTVLDFYYGKAYIIKLDADNLDVTSSTTDDIKLLLIFGH